LDYAKILRDLSDTHFPKAAKIVLVQDNLSTHKPASPYEAFAAEEARRLVERFEWHYTPKHGSWLNMAESELSVVSSQCLDRRIADKATLTEEVAAWEDSRTPTTPRPTGSSPPLTPGLSSRGSTPLYERLRAVVLFCRGQPIHCTLHRSNCVMAGTAFIVS